MAKYNYKLQSLLTIKEKLEEQKKNEFAKQNNILQEELNKLKSMYEDIDSVVQQQKENQTKSIKPYDLKLYIQYIEKLKQDIKKQEVVIKKQKEITEQARFDLLEQTKAKKSLEKLKEKDFEAFLEEEKKQEQKMIDEIVSYKYNAKE